jgi:hypothetical protein
MGPYQASRAPGDGSQKTYVGGGATRGSCGAPRQRAKRGSSGVRPGRETKKAALRSWCLQYDQAADERRQRVLGAAFRSGKAAGPQ